MAILDDGLTIEVLDHSGLVLLELRGELTVEEAPLVHEAVAGVLAGSPRNLQLGLRGVTFLDSGGVRALVLVRQRAAEAGVAMQLLGVSTQVQRTLEITNLASVFNIVE